MLLNSLNDYRPLTPSLYITPFAPSFQNKSTTTKNDPRSDCSAYIIIKIYFPTLFPPMSGLDLYSLFKHSRSLTSTSFFLHLPQSCHQMLSSVASLTAFESERAQTICAIIAFMSLSHSWRACRGLLGGHHSRRQPDVG